MTYGTTTYYERSVLSFFLSVSSVPPGGLPEALKSSQLALRPSQLTLRPSPLALRPSSPTGPLPPNYKTN